jgi:hypothetical protein
MEILHAAPPPIRNRLLAASAWEVQHGFRSGAEDCEFIVRRNYWNGFERKAEKKGANIAVNDPAPGHAGFLALPRTAKKCKSSI